MKIYLICLVVLFALFSISNATWWNNSYAYKQQINITNWNCSSANCQFGIPVQLNTNFTNGTYIRVLNDNETVEYNFWREDNWNYTNGSGNIWISAPNTTSMVYIYGASNGVTYDPSNIYNVFTWASAGSDMNSTNNWTFFQSTSAGTATVGSNGVTLYCPKSTSDSCKYWNSYNITSFPYGLIASATTTTSNGQCDIGITDCQTATGVSDTMCQAGGSFWGRAIRWYNNLSLYYNFTKNSGSTLAKSGRVYFELRAYNKTHASIYAVNNTGGIYTQSNVVYTAPLTNNNRIALLTTQNGNTTYHWVAVRAYATANPTFVSTYSSGDFNTGIPTITLLVVYPSNPIAKNNLSCNMTANNSDGSSILNITGDWYKNGVKMSGYNYTYINASNNTETVISNLTIGNYSVQDKISCSALAFSSKLYSVTNISSNVTINNTPPGMALSIYSTMYTNTNITYTLKTYLTNFDIYSMNGLNLTIYANGTQINATLVSIPPMSTDTFTTIWITNRPMLDENITFVSNMTNYTSSDTLSDILPIDPPSALKKQGYSMTPTMTDYRNFTWQQITFGSTVMSGTSDSNWTWRVFQHGSGRYIPNGTQYGFSWVPE